MERMAIRALVCLALISIVGCSGLKSEMTATDIDWRPQMLERDHERTTASPRYIPLTQEER